MRGLLLFLSFCLWAGSIAAQTPVIVDNGVVNAASFAVAQPVAPGSLVSIFGDNLASSLATASSIPFSTNLAGVTVTFNGVPAPVRDTIPGTPTSRSQVNTQIPWNALSGATQASVPVVVTRGGVASAAKQVSLIQAGPGIFTIPLGVGQAIAVNTDGSVAAPPGSIPGLTCRPAKRGEGVFFYANGIGPVDPPGVDGANSLDHLRTAVMPVTVIIDGIQVTPFFAGMAPEFPGVNQINFNIPQNARSGMVSLRIQVNGVMSPDQAATITIE
jgi:uncharacterized protein (TIGR03437 family)